MATSELKHYVRFDPTLLNDEDGVDAGMSRRAVNNLNHIADQYAQVVISAAPTVVFQPVDGFDEDTWYRLYTSPSFNLMRKADGDSYDLRVRLRVSSGHATDAASFRAVVAPAGDTEPELFRNGDNVFETSTTGTTYTRKTSLLVVGDTRLNDAVRRVSVVDTVGGEERLAEWLRCQLVVWGKIGAGTSAIPRLSGHELHQYIAPE